MNKSRVFIIAEAGVNHNGSLDLAKKLVDMAVLAGCDAVKFQTFKADNLLIASAPKADYQLKATPGDESQYEMIKRLELKIKDHQELISYCAERSIEFFSSPFDLESIDLLNSLKLDIFKIPSGEITNLPYLKKIASLNKRIILSTGMADLTEIRAALEVLESCGTIKEKISLLYCVSDYPASFEDIDLKTIIALKKEFSLKVGYSDHTLGWEAAIAAVALGAEIIEKHLTLDKSLPGPDHKASLNPDEFKAMVLAIRNIEKGLGQGVKKISFSEARNREVVRKSIVAAKIIRQGEEFSEFNLATKRPSGGISPMRWEDVIGKKAKRQFQIDELIEL